MPIRKIIQIDDELCDGCGQCVPSCAEGALRVINGKARLVSDVLCDGLGACLGECPTGALTVIERDEGVPPAATARPLFSSRHPAGIISIADRTPAAPRPVAMSGSRLRQWPVQLHLVPPTAPFFDGRDVLLAADCVPVAVGDFHTSLLDGHALAIACPKLDQHQEIYVDKLRTMIDEGGVRSLTVAVMEVPCCGGLLRLARQAMTAAGRQVPLRVITVSIRGEVLSDRA